MVIEVLKAFARACSDAADHSADKPARTVVAMVTERGIHIVAARGGHAHVGRTVTWDKIEAAQDPETQSKVLVDMIVAECEAMFDRAKGGK